MGDYIDDPNIKIQRHKKKESVESFDFESLADKIAQKVLGSLPKSVENFSSNKFEKNNKNDVQYREDDFDVSSTLSKLAESMTVVRKNESNFKDLGGTKINQADSDDTAGKVDLLSKLDD